MLIPGWMNSQGMYGDSYDVLEVWQKRIAPEEKVETDCLIGHSLGCSWAILNWKKYKINKLVLVNPLLPRRSILAWFSKWREFRKNEAAARNKTVVGGIKNIIFGIKTCFRLLAENFDEALDEIAKENIIVICGEKDTFYCDEKFKNYVRSKNIRLLEIKNAGHDWNEKFDREIEKIIS